MKALGCWEENPSQVAFLWERLSLSIKLPGFACPEENWFVLINV